MVVTYNHKFQPTDPRLGRHVHHDPRSKAYPYPAKAANELKSIQHHSNLPTFDQGQLGSCTGNAAVKCISYEPLWNPDWISKFTSEPVDERLAVEVYSAGTALDDYDGEYPPDDTGCDGLSVAKVLKSWGLISGYQHGLNTNAVLTALSQQPVIVGTRWHEDMFNPTQRYELKMTGAVSGGHEYVLDELDVENQRVWIQNSWGDSWGDEGRAWMSWSMLAKLLNDDGDCVIFTPIGTPAPTPVPTPGDPRSEFIKSAKEWLQVTHRTPNNVAFEKALKKYLDSL